MAPCNSRGPACSGRPRIATRRWPCCARPSQSGVNHIDTSDFYGPHVTNQIIREALHPYPDDLVIVTKIGARRGEDGSWLPAFSPEELTQAVHDNLRNLGAGRARRGQSAHHVRRASTCRRVDRGAAHRAGRAPAAGSGASYRAEQCHACADRGSAPDLRDRLRAEPVQSGASGRRRPDRRTCAATASPMCRSFRSAGSRRCSRRRCRTWRGTSAPRRCRSRSRGCCACAEHPADPGHVVRCASAREPRREGPDPFRRRPG